MTTTSPHRPVLRTPLVAGVALAALLGAGVTACGGDDGTGVSALSETTVGSTAEVSAGDVTSITYGSLSEAEVTGLLFMVEEEKLAHDVYVTLGAQWDVRQFDNIADAETTHIDAVRALLERYGLADPTEGNTLGEFADPSLAALYDELVVAGSASAVDALRVGALVEELDIVDLQARADETDETSIEAVYANLRAGSENHLRAFVAGLDARGEVYEPVHLDEAVYDEVLAASTGRVGPAAERSSRRS